MKIYRACFFAWKLEHQDNETEITKNKTVRVNMNCWFQTQIRRRNRRIKRRRGRIIPTGSRCVQRSCRGDNANATEKKATSASHSVLRSSKHSPLLTLPCVSSPPSLAHSLCSQAASHTDPPASNSSRLIAATLRSREGSSNKITKQNFWIAC